MRRRARVDANQSEITKALRAWGWVVLDTSQLGGGFPDLLTARGGRMELIEVKDGSKALSRQRATKAEARVYALLLAAGVRVRYINRVEQIAEL